MSHLGISASHVATLYEIRASYRMKLKKDLLIRVAELSRDGLTATCSKIPRILCGEPVHRTTRRPTYPAPVDRTYHITVLASTDMKPGRFRAPHLHRWEHATSGIRLLFLNVRSYQAGVIERRRWWRCLRLGGRTVEVRRLH